MNNQPTPETKSFYVTAFDVEEWAEKCIRLEKERDEAREKYATEATEHMLAINKICNERDEARDAILGWENKWKCAVDMAARAELERDDARKDAKLLSERLTALELQSTAELARLEQELINMKELHESNN
jgi:hypothetical protein